MMLMLVSEVPLGWAGERSSAGENFKAEQAEGIQVGLDGGSLPLP